MLSKELRIYYEKLTESVVSSDETLQQAVFDSLKQDPGIHQLVPYFVKFIIENVIIKSLYMFFEMHLIIIVLMINNVILYFEIIIGY